MLDPNARRAERSEAVPPLQQLCIGVLVVAARRMSSTTVTLERSNAALLERKLELQVRSRRATPRVRCSAWPRVAR